MNTLAPSILRSEQLSSHEECGLCSIEKSNLANTILFEDLHFFAVPSIGALVPGHVLLVPKAHSLNFAQLSDSVGSEVVRNGLQNFSEKFENCFGGTYIIFEHGPSTVKSSTGCSVDHAHLHLVPLQSTLIEAAKANFPQYSWEVLGSEPLSSYLQPVQGDYVMLRDSNGVVYRCLSSTFPSQLLRRVLLSHLNLNGDWNWRTEPRVANVRETIEQWQH